MVVTERHAPGATRPRGLAVEFDTFSFAVGLAIIAGGLAVAAPYLNALTVALTALAIAGWASGFAGAKGAAFAEVGPAAILGLSCTALGALAFVFLPSPFSVGRGLVLAGALLPLWYLDRGSRSGRSRRAAEVL